MAHEKELRSKIAGVNSVKTLTKAMELVAASKLKRAQDQMRHCQPYAIAIRKVIQRIIAMNLNYTPTYLSARAVKSVGYMVVSSRQGLCGKLNFQLFRAVLQEVQRHREAGITCQFALFGSKAVQFFSRLGLPSLAQKTGLGKAPGLTDVIGPCRVMLKAYEEGEIDELYVAYNRFISTPVQKAVIEPLLPISRLRKDTHLTENEKSDWDYIYESDPKRLLDALLPRGVESIVYQAVVENLACEQAARMMAMHTASESAQELMDDFTLQRHKIRQAGITQALCELMAGTTVTED